MIVSFRVKYNESMFIVCAFERKTENNRIRIVIIFFIIFFNLKLLFQILLQVYLVYLALHRASLVRRRLWPKSLLEARLLPCKWFMCFAAAVMMFREIIITKIVFSERKQTFRVFRVFRGSKNLCAFSAKTVILRCFPRRCLGLLIFALSGIVRLIFFSQGWSLAFSFDVAWRLRRTMEYEMGKRATNWDKKQDK